MSNLSFGLKTKEVEKISYKTLIWKVLLNLILGNRTAIISNDCDLIPNDIKEFCSFNDLSQFDDDDELKNDIIENMQQFEKYSCNNHR